MHTEASNSAAGVSGASASDQASTMMLPEACCRAAAAVEATCVSSCPLRNACWHGLEGARVVELYAGAWA